MSHVWVSQDWIVSLGLGQYSRTFEEQLIDGRLLNVLTKKDLYKYLKIHKKFHQMSIAYGVELLRSLDFDKDVRMFSHLNFVAISTDKGNYDCHDALKFQMMLIIFHIYSKVVTYSLTVYIQYMQNVPRVLK